MNEMLIFKVKSEPEKNSHLTLQILYYINLLHTSLDLMSSIIILQDLFKFEATSPKVHEVQTSKRSCNKLI